MKETKSQKAIRMICKELLEWIYIILVMFIAILLGLSVGKFVVWLGA